MSTRGSYYSFAGVLDRLAIHGNTLLTTQRRVQVSSASGASGASSATRRRRKNKVKSLKLVISNKKELRARQREKNAAKVNAALLMQRWYRAPPAPPASPRKTLSRNQDV